MDTVPSAETDAKRPKVDAPSDCPAEDDFDLLLEAGTIDQNDGTKAAPAEQSEETARRQFVECLAAAGWQDGDRLPNFIEELKSAAPKWGYARRWRCSALLLVYVARASRVCRAAFVAEGLPLLGAVLQEGISVLEAPDRKADHQEATMWVLACLSCLRALPIGRATMWEHRGVLGKPFDRLHRWCGQQKSAIAAELRGPTTALCRRWRKQPKPAEQESDPAQKALRRKVVDMIAQGLAGIAGINSPASPAVMASPGRLPPVSSASEVEAVLFTRYNSIASGEYRQHARMLRSNLALPGNVSLREGVLSGDVTPDELIAMNSNALAPEALQEQRLLQQQRAERANILKHKLQPPKIFEDGRTEYNPATAPPALETRESSDISRADSAGPVASDSEIAPVDVAMEPPPTPFREGLANGPLPVVSGSGSSPAAFTPDVMATPAPGHEDEDEATLFQWLSRPV